VLGFVQAIESWQIATSGSPIDSGSAHADTDRPAFESSVELAGGWLPGSSAVSAQASAERGPEAQRGSGPWYQAHWWDRVAVAPNVRVAVQIGVAVTGAIVLGEFLSERRFYWAVIAAFITFMGANNTGEQLRKGLARVVGTVVGVLIGATLAHLVGDRTDLAIVVILVALFFGLYLVRISYAFMVIGVTIMVSQLYVQLDEFSNHLLLLRLEETALGAGIAALTVICILPLRTGRVALVAARQYLDALSAVVQSSVQQLQDPRTPSELRGLLRHLDAEYQSLTATIASMGTPYAPRDADREKFLQTATAARNYARNLAVDTVGVPAPSAPAREELSAAHAQFAESLAALSAGLQEPRRDRAGHTYVRSAFLFDQVATRMDGDYACPQQLALRDLQLIDGALAALAGLLGLGVKALETV